MEFVGSLAWVGAQRAIRPCGAERGHLDERTLKTGVGAQAALERTRSGVKGTVEQHGSHILRELLGIHRAQPCPITLPKIRQLLIAEHRSQHVEVAGGVARADSSQNVSAAGHFGVLVDNILGVLLGPLHTGALCGEQVCAAVGLGFGVTVNRGLRGADTARVQPDNVKPVGQPACPR